MELHKAIKNIVDTDGIDILYDVRIVNILSDFKAFDAISASKYILRSIIADGYSRKLYALGKWDSKSESLCQQFISTTGFQSDIVRQVFQCIAFGLGWINNVTPLQSPNQGNAKVNPAQERSIDASGLRFGYKALNKKSEKFQLQFKEDAERYLDSIIELKGDWNILGAKITPSPEYTIYSNDSWLKFHFEIDGKVKYRMENEYVTYLKFRVVIYNSNNRILGTTLCLLEKTKFNATYQVVTSDSFSEQSFKTIGNISRVVIYWEE